MYVHTIYIGMYTLSWLFDVCVRVCIYGFANYLHGYCVDPRIQDTRMKTFFPLPLAHYFPFFFPPACVSPFIFKGYLAFLKKRMQEEGTYKCHALLGKSLKTQQSYFWRIILTKFFLYIYFFYCRVFGVTLKRTPTDAFKFNIELVNLYYQFINLWFWNSLFMASDKTALLPRWGRRR